MKAMILAAGYGTRLGDLTTDIPKPMLDLEGRPILEYIIAHLQRHGFDQIMINLHYHPEMIREYFGDGSRWNVRLDYSYESALLGTAGGLKKAAAFFDGCDDLLVQYGDVLTDDDFLAMLAFHRENRALVTLMTHRRPGSNSIVTVGEGGRIERFVERPGEKERSDATSSWVHSGVAIARYELLAHIPSGIAADLPRDVYAPLVRDGASMFAWPLSGYRCAVDSPERLAELRRAVRDGKLDITLPPSYA